MAAHSSGNEAAKAFTMVNTLTSANVNESPAGNVRDRNTWCR